MCGAVEYEYTGEPAVTALCQCTDCQKWSGGAYTSNVVVPRTNMKVVKGNTPVVGALKTYDAVGNSGKVNKHFFCGTCGSSLYTELEVMPEMGCIKAGGLDGGKADLGNVGVEFYTKDRVSFSKAIEGAK